MPLGHYDHYKIRGRPKTAEHNRKNSEAHLGIRKPCIAGENNPSKRIDVREKIRKALLGRKSPWTSERNKTSGLKGNKNPMWKGGISRLPYPMEFNAMLKRLIKERDQFICQLCLKKEDAQKLSVHHIDYDKANNSAENLISLCKKCHPKTNTNRENWKSNMGSLALCNSLNL